MALSQTNIKRLLGYSSISHLGYLLVALIALQSGEMSMEAVGVYLAGYLFSSLGAFGVVSLMSSPYRGPDADSLFSYLSLIHISVTRSTSRKRSRNWPMVTTLNIPA